MDTYRRTLAAIGLPTIILAVMLALPICSSTGCATTDASTSQAFVSHQPATYGKPIQWAQVTCADGQTYMVGALADDPEVANKMIAGVCRTGNECPDTSVYNDSPGTKWCTPHYCTKGHWEGSGQNTKFIWDCPNDFDKFDIITGPLK